MENLETLYREHNRKVFLFLLSLCGDEDLAEELTQETMFRAMMNIGAFRGDCRLSVWLCQIAKNLLRDHQRRARRSLPLGEEALRGDSGGDPAKALEDQEDAGQILRRLHLLPEPYREVFTLHALEDVPLVQISRRFGRSDSWARVTYYRAKAMIMEQLKEEEEG